MGNALLFRSATEDDCTRYSLTKAYAGAVAPKLLGGWHHRLSKTQPKPQSQEPPPPIRAARPAVDLIQPSKWAPEPLGRGAWCVTLAR